MAEHTKAWQCVGCGRIEASQTCIGICEDRPVELVYAADYERMAQLVRLLATTTPRAGEWESTYRTLQARARVLLKALA